MPISVCRHVRPWFNAYFIECWLWHTHAGHTLSLLFLNNHGRMAWVGAWWLHLAIDFTSFQPASMRIAGRCFEIPRHFTVKYRRYRQHLFSTCLDCSSIIFRYILLTFIMPANNNKTHTRALGRKEVSYVTGEAVAALSHNTDADICRRALKF